jgi:glycerate 2-kinase
VSLEFAARLDAIARTSSPVARPVCVIAGGETTVTVRGRGTGGRCQEFALALVPEVAAMRDVVVLAAGTDGSDGPTDAAGAVVDPSTLARARAKGLDVERALAENDSNAFFASLGDLVVTGPTGSNLMDVYLGVVG